MKLLYCTRVADTTVQYVNQHFRAIVRLLSGKIAMARDRISPSSRSVSVGGLTTAIRAAQITLNLSSYTVQ